MQTKQAIINATRKLKNKTPSPQLEAELLLSHALNKPREYILTHPEKQLTKTQITNYKLLITKRIKGIPLAYITGYKYFYGLKFLVDKNVLIPRPETELMVNEALKHIIHNKKHITFVDVGTGSGCIIISILKNLNRQSSIVNRKFLASDISKPALTIARQNAKFHKMDEKITFLHGNLLEPILNNHKYLKPSTYYLITANLPYLTPKKLKNSPTIQSEPKLALLAGPDGLKYYRQLFKQINAMCSTLCVTGHVLCEINPAQSKSIKQLAKTHLPQSKIKIKKDLRNLNRLVIISI